MDPDANLQASDYASGFASQIYPGRNVPDVSGLVGMQPRAKYIMLPVEPEDEIDASSAGGRHPNGDQTAADDGWAAFSGTSAAAPQIAGVCALIKQANPALGPAEVREVLQKTARDVTAGNCHPNTGANPAAPGPDLATGFGLVNAHAAVMIAKLRAATDGCVTGPAQPAAVAAVTRPARLNTEDLNTLEKLVVQGEVNF